MIYTRSPYEACQELFAGYPLAAEAVDHGGRVVRSMVLMLRDGDDARFFVLSYDSAEDHPSYWLRSWPAGDIVDIGADSRAVVPDEVASAVTCGLPIPRHGSLFGWTYGDTVTALLPVYAQYTPASPDPSWAVMPLASIPAAQWPSFTRNRFLGHWFWEDLRAGRIIALADLIAGTPETVYWVHTKAVLGSDCCAVAHDVRSPEGPTLRCGRYVYYQALQTGKPVPPLTALLADTGKIDLAPRFRRSVEVAAACSGLK